jgi:hypothetical protein
VLSTGGGPARWFAGAGNPGEMGFAPSGTAAYGGSGAGSAFGGGGLGGTVGNSGDGWGSGGAGCSLINTLSTLAVNDGATGNLLIDEFG